MTLCCSGLSLLSSLSCDWHFKPGWPSSEGGCGFCSLRVARCVPAALPCVVHSFLCLSSGCLHAWVHAGCRAPVHYQGCRSRSPCPHSKTPRMLGAGGLSGQSCAACADGRVSLSRGTSFSLCGARVTHRVHPFNCLATPAITTSWPAGAPRDSDTRSVHWYQERAIGASWSQAASLWHTHKA